MPGQGWMWWRKSRRRTALRQRRPVSSRCRRWWGGRGWNHNMCWNTTWGHAIVASCCINIISNIRYQLSALSVLSALSWSSEQTNVPSIAGDSCPFTCPKWRHRPFQSSSSSHIFPRIAVKCQWSEPISSLGGRAKQPCRLVDGIGTSKQILRGQDSGNANLLLLHNSKYNKEIVRSL